MNQLIVKVIKGGNVSLNLDKVVSISHTPNMTRAGFCVCVITEGRSLLFRCNSEMNPKLNPDKPLDLLKKTTFDTYSVN